MSSAQGHRQRQETAPARRSPRSGDRLVEEHQLRGNVISTLRGKDRSVSRTWAQWLQKTDTTTHLRAADEWTAPKRRLTFLVWTTLNHHIADPCPVPGPRRHRPPIPLWSCPRLAKPHAPASPWVARLPSRSPGASTTPSSGRSFTASSPGSTSSTTPSRTPGECSVMPPSASTREKDGRRS